MWPGRAGAGSVPGKSRVAFAQSHQQEAGPGSVPTPLPPAQWPEAIPQPQYVPSFAQPREPETLRLPAQPAPAPARPVPAAENAQPSLGLPPGAVTLLLAPAGGRVAAGNLPLALESAAGSLAQPVQARIDVLEAAR